MQTIGQWKPSTKWLCQISRNKLLWQYWEGRLLKNIFCRYQYFARYTAKNWKSMEHEKCPRFYGKMNIMVLYAHRDKPAISISRCVQRLGKYGIPRPHMVLWGFENLHFPPCWKRGISRCGGDPHLGVVSVGWKKNQKKLEHTHTHRLKLKIKAKTS